MEQLYTVTLRLTKEQVSIAQRKLLQDTSENDEILVAMEFMARANEALTEE